MSGKRGFGAKCSYETTTPGTFVDIVGLTNITPFGLKTDIIDVTAHDSTNNYREKVPGSVDAGQLTLTGNYDPGAVSHIWLQTEAASSTVRNFKITWPGSPTKTTTFSGYVTAMGPDAPFDGKLTFSATVEITGAITHA